MRQLECPRKFMFILKEAPIMVIVTVIGGTQLQNEERSRNLHTKMVSNKSSINCLNFWIKICVSQARISCLSTSKYVFVFNPHITTAENRRPSKERVNPISYAGGGPQTDPRQRNGNGRSCFGRSEQCGVDKINTTFFRILGFERRTNICRAGSEWNDFLMLIRLT